MSVRGNGEHRAKLVLAKALTTQVAFRLPEYLIERQVERMSKEHRGSISPAPMR